MYSCCNLVCGYTDFVSESDEESEDERMKVARWSSGGWLYHRLAKRRLLGVVRQGPLVIWGRAAPTIGSCSRLRR